MEFQLTTDVQAIEKSNIGFNFEEIEAYVKKQTEPYKGLVFTDANIGDAKPIRASLNKLKEAIDASRISVKKQWNTPYLAFEERCKSLTKLIDEPIGELDGQIKDYEERKKAEKKERLKKASETILEPVSGYLTFENVFKQNWLNVSFVESSAIKEMECSAQIVQRELEAIRAENSMYEAAMLLNYKENQNLPGALAFGRKLAETAAAEEKRKAAVEAARAPLCPPVSCGDTRGSQCPPSSQVEVQQLAVSNTSKAEETLLTVDFRVRTTPGQLQALGVYMKSRGIEYGKIPEATNNNQ